MFMTGGIGLRRAGRLCAVVAWPLWAAMQIAADDPFPPDISLSQYGLGPYGWVFSLWALLLAAGPLLLLRYRPVPGAVRWLMPLGALGCVITALVRTDKGGLMLSWQARIHTASAVIATIALPLAIVLVLRQAAPVWRRWAMFLAVLSALSGAGLLLAAAGVDSAGMGQAASWGFWEGVLVVLEMVLVSLYAVAADTIRIWHRSPR